MAYLVAADFRGGSSAWYTSGLTLSDTEAPTAQLTSAIAAYSLQFDDWCNDHFESESLTLELNGDGSDKLILPKRCTAVTTVKTRDANGALTTQSSSVYRLTSSLENTGSRRRSKDAMDTLDIIPLSSGLSATLDGPYAWPCGPQTVQVIGSFGWTTTPERVKRAVALLVYDHFRKKGDSLYRVARWTQQGESFDRSLTTPSGIQDVDDIIADLKRDTEWALA